MTYRYVTACGLIAAVVGLVLSAGLAAEEAKTSTDWAHWRGPDYNGISKEAQFNISWGEGGPKVLWKKSLGIGFSSFAISAGRAYTMGNADGKDTVYCFDAATGKKIWKYPYPQPLDAKSYEGGTHSTPTVDGKMVYTFSKRGDLFCLDAAKGDVIWKKSVSKEFGAKRPTWGFAGSPLIAGKLVIVNAGSNGMAFDKKSGDLVWKSGTGRSGYSTPVPFKAGETKAVAIFGEKKLFALNPADGKELWSFPWETRYDVNAADPIVSGDRMFISSGYNKGCALLKIAADKAVQVWRNRKMRNHFNSTVLYKGNLYGFDEKQLRCLDLATSDEKWTQRGLGKGSLMIAGDKLIILSEDGRLVIAEASPAGYKQLAAAQILTGKCWTVPVLSGGKIYARNAAGDAVCVDVSKK